MAETTNREGGNYSPDIPSRNLPPVEYRDLPEPKKLRQIVGASVIILATAIGSGEFVLWPYITSQIGFVFMWGAIVGFLIQYFINMEIERYTLATGETAITGFARFWKPWWWLFIIFVMFQNFWPGWATGASTTLSYIFGFGGNAITYLTVAALIAIGIALTTSPVVYQTVEKVQGAMVITIMAFVFVAVFIGTTGEAWGALITEGVGNPGLPIGQEGLGIALLLGALAFAGAGGANNLVQSNYIRDKGMGMGLRIPRVVSPITGEEEASEGIGYMFPQDVTNMRRWKGWWRVANIEQFVTFFVIGVISLIVFTVLTYSTVPVGQTDARDLEFIRVEGEALRDVIGPGFGIAFWLAGTFALFSTNLGIVDYNVSPHRRPAKHQRHSQQPVLDGEQTLLRLCMAHGHTRLVHTALRLQPAADPYNHLFLDSRIADVYLFRVADPVKPQGAAGGRADNRLPAGRDVDIVRVLRLLLGHPGLERA